VRPFHPAIAIRFRWRRALPPVLLAALALVAGVATGAAATGWLPASERQSLDAYLGTFFRGLVNGQLAPTAGAVFRASLASELRLAAAVWAGGLFAFGFPLALGALFARGFALGFTVGFLAAQEGSGGLLLAALAVLPGSLVAIPTLIASGAVAVAYSLRLLVARLGRAPRLTRRDVGVYTGAAVASALALLLAGLADGYLVPGLVRALGPHLGL